MITNLNLYVKACKLFEPTTQVSGYYVGIVRNGKLSHRIINGTSNRDYDFSPVSSKFEKSFVATYEDIDVKTLRRCTNKRDINGRILYEHDILEDKDGNSLKVEFHLDGQVVLVLIDQDATLSQDVQSVIYSHKMKWVGDPYS